MNYTVFFYDDIGTKPSWRVAANVNSGCKNIKILIKIHIYSIEKFIIPIILGFYSLIPFLDPIE